MNYSGNPKYANNTSLQLTFEFGVEIIRFSEKLIELKQFDLARQILKSGTSIGANLREAQNAESKADFKHKIKISLKEADETEYWLLLIKEVYDLPDIQILLHTLGKILRVLNKIISTLTKRENQRSAE